MLKTLISNKFSKFIVMLFILLTISNLVWAEEQYDPCPIIFMHGFNNRRTSNDALWYLTRSNFKKFFEYYPNYPSINPLVPKYWNEPKYYMNVLDYRSASNGDIDRAADELKGRINTIVGSDPGRKVIIVAHSSGGLATRRLLAKDSSYQNKIERVVFIGTPHLGSPLATGVILIDRMIPKLEEARRDNSNFAGLDRGLNSNWQNLAYYARYGQITSALWWYKTIVNWNYFPFPVQEVLSGYRSNPNPYGSPDPNSPGRYNPNVPHHEGQKVAIGQLVVPADVTATKTFNSIAISENGVMVSTEPLIIEASYGASETFFNKPLAVPANRKIIQGTGLASSLILGFPAGLLFQMSADYSGLPAGNTFGDLLGDSDGIVTEASQTAMGGANYQIPNSHITETNAWEIILQAIEDTPIIESARVVPLDWNATYAQPSGEADSWYYVIFKLKDYLLADIEVEKLDLVTGTGTIDLIAGQSSYKPYQEFGKSFLKTRSCTGDETWLASYFDINDNLRYLYLTTGEFYVITEIPFNAQSINIKIKNPAAQYDSTKFTAERTFTISRPKVTTVDFTPHNRRLTNAYYSPWNIHAIDVSPYDESYSYVEHDIILPCPDSLPNEVNLSFKIEESPIPQVKVNAWLYSRWWWGDGGVCKKFSIDRPVNLIQEGSLYGKYFDPNTEPFATWGGEKEGGGYVLPYPNQVPTGGGPYYYELKVTIEPNDNPSDDKIYLLGSNWDDPNHDNEWLNSGGQWVENINNDIIIADPSFIQFSRREGISW